MKSILDGYLTDGCKDCANWSDGTDGRGYGCNTSCPIDWCPYFQAEMEKEHQARLDEMCEAWELEEKERLEREREVNTDDRPVDSDN